MSQYCIKCQMELPNFSRTSTKQGTVQHQGPKSNNFGKTLLNTTEGIFLNWIFHI